MAGGGPRRGGRLRGFGPVIFATTGTQLPFPRLIAALDALAPSLDEPVIAQIGPDPTAYPHLETHATLTPGRFDALFAEARIVVAHAGIGTILSARRHGRPLILVPRRFDHGEHRNDHQLATARELEQRAGLSVAWQVKDLAAILHGPTPEPGPMLSQSSHEASDCPLARLQAHLRTLVDGA